MMVDIDNFKRINETYGHGGGDHILQQVAESIFTQCRASDFVFRYGGEEFVVVLIEASAASAFETPEWLRQKFQCSNSSCLMGMRKILLCRLVSRPLMVIRISVI